MRRKQINLLLELFIWAGQRNIGYLKKFRNVLARRFWAKFTARIWPNFLTQRTWLKTGRSGMLQVGVRDHSSGLTRLGCALDANIYPGQGITHPKSFKLKMLRTVHDSLVKLILVH